MAPTETLPQPLPHDLRSEPFWRMNKYFTQQQAAVPGLWGLAWPPSHSLSSVRALPSMWTTRSFPLLVCTGVREGCVCV